MDWTTLLVAIIASGAFTSIVTALIDLPGKRKKQSQQINETLEALVKEVNEIKQVNTKVDKLEEAVKHILLYILREDCIRYINAGYIEVDELRALHEQFCSYKEIGGNGYVDNLMERVNKLPNKLPE